MSQLRAGFRERMEIHLLLADAAIALNHDDISLLAGQTQHAATFVGLLEELGAKPMDSLPFPANHIHFPEGTRIGLFHDATRPFPPSARG